MKLAIKGFVCATQYDWKKEIDYSIWAYDPTPHSASVVCIREQEFVVEIADDYDIRPKQVAALKKEKSRILGEAQAKATNIEEQIQRLLAIEDKSAA